MSSTQPNPDNDYQLPPAPQRAVFDRAMFNHVFGSVGSRLRAIEAKRDELQTIIDELRLFGLLRLDEAIVPLIEGVQLQLTNLAQEVTGMQAANASIIEDFQAVTAVNLEDLAASISAAEQQLTDVQTQFAIILAGGLPAGQVLESDIRVFLTPEQKAEISSLREDLTALAGNLDGGTF